MAPPAKSFPFPSLSWSAPLYNEDGTPLTDLASFMLIRRLETDHGPEPCRREADIWLDPRSRERYCVVAHLGVAPKNPQEYLDREVLPVLLRTYGIVAIDSIGNQSEPAYYEPSPSLDVIIAAPVIDREDVRHLLVVQALVQALAQRNEMRTNQRPHHAAMILWRDSSLYPTEIRQTGLTGRHIPALQPVTSEDANAVPVLAKRALESLADPSQLDKADLMNVVTLANNLLRHRPLEEPSRWGQRSVIIVVDPERLSPSPRPSQALTAEPIQNPRPQSITELAPETRIYVLEAQSGDPGASAPLLRSAAAATQGLSLTLSVDEPLESLVRRLYAHLCGW